MKLFLSVLYSKISFIHHRTIHLFRKLRIIYTCQPFLSHRHEICILGVLGFWRRCVHIGRPLEISEDVPKISKGVSNIFPGSRHSLCLAKHNTHQTVLLKIEELGKCTIIYMDFTFLPLVWVHIYFLKVRKWKLFQLGVQF